MTAAGALAHPDVEGQLRVGEKDSVVHEPTVCARGGGKSRRPLRRHVGFIAFRGANATSGHGAHRMRMASPVKDIAHVFKLALKGWKADNCLSMGAALAFYSL